MKSISYVKVALFFVILISAGTGYIIFSANGISFFNTKIYETVLTDASGLSTRSKIYLAGVPVGKVQGIELNGSEAMLKIVFLKDVELHQDAVISRKPSSLLGTSVLSVDPGSVHYPIIPAGSFIRSAPPTGDMNEAFNMVQDMGSQLELLLDEFRTNQMALLTVSLEAVTSIAKKFDTQSEIQLDNISRILESLAFISERTERLLRRNEKEIDKSVADIYEVMADLRLITGDIASGRGNLGQTIYDERLYNSILATVGKTEDAAEKLGEAIGGVSDILKNANGVVNSAGEVVNKALGIGVQVDTNASYDVLAKTMRASASIRLEPASSDRWYRIGISSTPEGITSRTVTETTDISGSVIMEDTTEIKYIPAIDAELARRIGIVTLRGGLYETTAGLGLDLQPLKWMNISGELFRFQTGELPNLKSTVTFYPFFDPDSDKPWHWIYLRGGINNALSGDRDFFIGGGLRFADREVKGLVGFIPAFN
jgi:phospholipid/cholesterol/gamma-HCH transport system substrate-binding protein